MRVNCLVVINVNNEIVIEEYLEKVFNGQSDLVLDLLPYLAEHMLYTPVLMFSQVKDQKDITKIKVPTIIRDDRSLIPTFTSEEYLLKWSEDKNQCFSVLGGDLALSLPKDTGLLINPGQANSLELSPGQVLILAQVEATTFAINKIINPRLHQGTISEIECLTDLEGATSESVFRQPTVVFNAEKFRKQLDEASSNSLAELYDVEGLIAALHQVCSTYSEIEEAIFQESPNIHASALVCLRANHLTPERRFVFVEQIAEISRWYLGTAGAIEIYDNVSDILSESDDVFSSFKPFYVKSKHAESLSNEDDKDPFAEDETSSTWSSIGKKGLDILGSFRSTSKQ